jgi:predicted MPP superfamily phosphohydrolase
LFHLAKAILCFYVILRFVMPLPWPRWLKLLISALLMIVFQHSLISLLVFGTMFSPEVPRTMMVVVNWLAGSILLLAGFQFAVDVIAVAAVAIRRKRQPIAPRLRYGIGVVAICLAAYGVSQAIRVPPVKEVEVAIRDLPQEFDGYRLVQLTDLHISRLFEAPWVEQVVEDTNRLEPDLIVITGDLIDGDEQARADDVAPLASLRAKDGVFTIPGNHEYYFGHDGWMRHFGSLGHQTISNGHVVLKRGSEQLVLAGVNDLSATQFGLPGPDVKKALEGAPVDAPVILLDHQPKEARGAARAGVDLQLSGHTHGGLIKGFDRFIASFNNGFVSGIYDVDGMSLYVNNGTALWIGFAMRIGVPSELTVITLRKAP